MNLVKISFLAASVVVLTVTSAVAQEQQTCDSRANIINHLKQKYSEAPVGLGIANNGGLVEIMKSPSGKTWTLTITTPNGMTCLMAAGEKWGKPPATATQAKDKLGPSSH